jgi:hypothetical protein
MPAASSRERLAPLNLPVPPYVISNTTILIGDDKKGA